MGAKNVHQKNFFKLYETMGKPGATPNPASRAATAPSSLYTIYVISHMVTCIHEQNKFRGNSPSP